MNTGIFSRRLPSTTELTDEDCHTLELTLTDLLHDACPGLIPSIAKIPLHSGLVTEITLRQREVGMLN